MNYRHTKKGERGCLSSVGNPHGAVSHEPMRSTFLTALISCKDEDNAKKLASHLKEHGLTASYAGRAVQAVKKYNIPALTPQSEFHVFAAHSNAMNELSDILLPLEVPFIILDDTETDPNISMQDIVESCGTDNLFNAIFDMECFCGELAMQGMGLEEPRGEPAEEQQVILQHVSALTTIMSLAKKALADSLMGKGRSEFDC
jgi:hypothetical protein